MIGLAEAKHRMRLTSHGNSTEEASAWLARLGRGLREAEGPRMREWLKERGNQAAILQAAKYACDPDLHALLSQVIPNSSALLPSRGKRRYHSLCLGAAASVCIFGAAALAFTGRTPWTAFDAPGPAPSVITAATYATAAGERRQLQLPDGTRILMNTRTRVSVHYTPRMRTVSLLDGEASFDVVDEPARPFRLYAARREFEATEARLNVHLRTPMLAELTVMENRVKIRYAPPRMPDIPARRREPLTYGEAVIGTAETAEVEPGFQVVRPITADERDARLAWHEEVVP